jgi:GNAT superfamily N-acetyltransferase
MLIRRAVTTDVDAIMVTHVAAIRETCCSAYGPDEIAAWTSGGMNPERYLPGITEGRTLVAVADEAVVGFCEFDAATGEVLGMFVDPLHLRRGIGRGLLQTVETTAVQRGLGRLHLQSTLNAVDFYRANGFVVDEMALFSLRAGIEVPCAVMHKDLRSVSRSE